MGRGAHSDQENGRCGEETVPGYLEEVLRLLIGGQELGAVDMAVVVDLPVDLIEEEGLHGVVELVFVQVPRHVAHRVVGPVCVLHSVKEAVVLGNP